MKETLEKSWEVETLKAVLVRIEQEVKPVQQKDYFDVLHAPYVKGFQRACKRNERVSRLGMYQREEKLFTQSYAG